MADIEEAIVSRITATTTAVLTRVYPIAVVDSSTVTPYITFEKVSGEHEKTMAGMCGIANAEYDITIVTKATPGSSGYKDVKAIRNTVRVNMDGKTGTWGGVAVRACFIRDEFDAPNLAVGVEQQKREGVGLRTEFWYRESTT